MAILVYSLLWVLQNLDHQPYLTPPPSSGPGLRCGLHGLDRLPGGQRGLSRYVSKPRIGVRLRVPFKGSLTCPLRVLLEVEP